MIDQNTERSGAINPAGVSEVKELNRPRPVDDKGAEDCIKQLKKIAQKQGIRFGLPELRRASIDDLLAEGDQDQGKEPGMLRKAGWQDDQLTREFLENAQRYAEEQAEEWIRKIQSDLGLTREQLEKMSFDDLRELARAKGWRVEVVSDDPKEQAEVEKTLEYLRNAWEKAAADLEDIHTETEEGAEVVDDLKKISDRAGEVILNIIANGANNPQEVYIKQGERLAREILPEGGGIDEFLTQERDSPDQKAEFEEQKQDLALAYDLQITGLTEKLRGVKDRRQRESLETRLKKLKEERQKLKTKDEKGDEVAIPDQIGVFAAEFGRQDLSQVRDLFELAASDPKVREGLLERIKSSGLADKEEVVKNILDKIHNRQELEKWKRRGKSVAVLALVLLLLLAWRGSQADKQRGGGMMG